MPQPQPSPRSASLAIASGSVDPGYAERVAAHLDMPVEDMERKKFPDSELYARYMHSLRGSDVFIINTLAHRSMEYPGEWSTNDSLGQLVDMVDAAANASADHVTAVAPYFAYARQDKKDDGRVAIAARRKMREIEAAGADRIVTIELHSPQIQGFTIAAPVENLSGANVLLPNLHRWAEAKKDRKLRVAAPDLGRVKLAGFIANTLLHNLRAQGVDADINVAVINKEHESGTTNVRASHVIGDVEDADCVVVDDIIGTGGTTKMAINELVGAGARTITAAAIHAVAAGNAIEALAGTSAEKFIVSDTIPLPEEAGQLVEEGRIEVATTDRLIAGVIRRIHYNLSVSESDAFSSRRVKFSHG